MKKRITTPEERALFEAVLAGKISLGRQRPWTPPAAPAKTSSVRVSAPSGIDGRTSEKLHRGDIRPEAKLDLHGLTERAAYGALAAFLASAQHRGCHLVLVVTGKGIRRPDPYAPFDMELETRARGVLKAMVPRWLAEPQFARLIADVRTAHVRHGGDGALYVYLRKRQA